jgi:hypothetical protein
MLTIKMNKKKFLDFLIFKTRISDEQIYSSLELYKVVGGGGGATQKKDDKSMHLEKRIGLNGPCRAHPWGEADLYIVLNYTSNCFSRILFLCTAVRIFDNINFRRGINIFYN